MPRNTILTNAGGHAIAKVSARAKPGICCFGRKEGMFVNCVDKRIRPMAHDWRSKVAAFCLDKLARFAHHAPGAVTKSLLGSAKEISIRWGFFAGFRNYNYQTNPPGKKKGSILMKTKIRNSISGLLLIPLVLACFAVLPSVQAAPATRSG